MRPRAPLVLIGLCVLVAPIGLVLGRWSVATTPASILSPTTVPRSEAHGFASAKPSLAEPGDLSNVTIENLGQVEFDLAFELLSSAPKDALIAWAKRLETLPVTPRRTAAIGVFFKTLAQIDTKTAVDLALSMERADPRWVAIGAVGVAAPLANLTEVARMYTAINETKVPLVGELIGRWSMIDPEATAQFLAGYSGKVTNDEIARFLGNWAALDPVAAMQWLQETDASRHCPRVYADFYAGWILKERTAALEDLAAHGADKTFKKAIETVSETLFTDSPDGARSFVLMLPTIAAQKAAIEQIAGHVTGRYLGNDYLHLETEDVAKWLFSLPDNLWHEEIGYIIDRWAGYDPSAVDTWLNQVPPQTKDRLLAEQCRAFNWNVPAAGLKAGLQIRDRELREETLRGIFEGKVKELQEELLRKAELSGEQAAELERILKKL